VLSKLKEHNFYFAKVADEICQELLPKDGEDDDETTSEVEALGKTVEIVRSKLHYLQDQFKKRKYRHCPEKLDETFISASQFSLFDSQETQDSQGIACAYQSTQPEENSFSQREETTGYNKKSILSEMDPKTRRRRVARERDEFKEWARKQKCSSTELAGLFIYLENFMSNKKLSELGWSIFTSNCLSVTHEATLNEAM
jgi:hypothetical protein